MGVFNGRGARWSPLNASLEMRQSVRLWETAYIVILDPGPNSSNFVTKNNSAFVWDGLARYQPYRKDIPVAQVTSPTTTATARFQVDFSKDGALPDIRTNFQIVILEPILANTALDADEQIEAYPDPLITGYVHVVTSGMNSSLAWIRTIETIVDTRTRENFAIEPDGLGGFQWEP